MSDLGKIFLGLKTLLQKYSPPFVSKVDSDSAYELWSQNEVIIAEWNDATQKQVDIALEEGFRCYKTKGWV